MSEVLSGLRKSYDSQQHVAQKVFTLKRMDSSTEGIASPGISKTKARNKEYLFAPSNWMELSDTTKSLYTNERKNTEEQKKSCDHSNRPQGDVKSWIQRPAGENRRTKTVVATGEANHVSATEDHSSDRQVKFLPREVANSPIPHSSRQIRRKKADLQSESTKIPANPVRRVGVLKLPLSTVLRTASRNIEDLKGLFNRGTGRKFKQWPDFCHYIDCPVCITVIAGSRAYKTGVVERSIRASNPGLGPGCGPERFSDAAAAMWKTTLGCNGTTDRVPVHSAGRLQEYRRRFFHWMKASLRHPSSRRLHPWIQNYVKCGPF
ncbi:unnamed protein product [Soboliphyme baturini]|uniref:Uncharacterized protein n=1 Tax=Soboliphyme baturini TaxID=241478 RepID=A0A183J6R5_9BILA|nr:unnamed protein product [Soboliphyme baturini]